MADSFEGEFFIVAWFCWAIAGAILADGAVIPADVVDRRSHPYDWAAFILIGNGLSAILVILLLS